MTPDWDKLIEDVNERIAALRLVWEATAATPERHQMIRELSAPALRLLADFCAAIDIAVEGDDPP